MTRFASKSQTLNVATIGWPLISVQDLTLSRSMPHLGMMWVRIASWVRSEGSFQKVMYWCQGWSDTNSFGERLPQAAAMSVADLPDSSMARLKTEPLVASM